MDGMLKWLQIIDPTFAFLVALPFLVVAAAWLGEIVRNKLRRH